ncbi:roundabout homolog 1 isoform X2 [Ixodes scapularis]
MAHLDRHHPCFLWITTASWIIAAGLAARTSDEALPGRAPRITEHPGDVVVRKHEPVTLRCRADAEPPARLSWFHEGHPVRDSATRMVLPEGQLFFLHVQHSRRDQDTGIYWCTATNALGEARSRNASVELAVEFLLDKTQPVVSSDDVRDFSGVVEDDKVYQVYWAGDARTKGSFYDAKVLYMAGE